MLCEFGWHTSFQFKSVFLCCFTCYKWNSSKSDRGLCTWSNPTRPVSSSLQMDSLQHWLLAWNCSNHTWSETAGARPKDNSHKTKNLIHFPSLFLRINPALFHIPVSLFQVHALWLVRGKSLKQRKKKRKSRKRFCSSTSLATYLESKLRW